MASDKGKGKRHVHKPSAFFTKSELDHKRNDWSFLVLNQPVTSKPLLSHFMRVCGYRVCADGGANRLYDLLVAPVKPYTEYLSYLQKYFPDAIHGDLDSIRDGVRKFYEEHGVQVTLDKGQTNTDFGKALKKIRDHRIRHAKAKHPSTGSASQASASSDHTHEAPQTSVIVCGSIAGRVDQGIGLLSEIIREQIAHPDFPIYLIGENSLSFLLSPGENVIDFAGHVSTNKLVRAASTASSKSSKGRPSDLLERTSSWSIDATLRKGLFTENAGILPIAGPATITTKGFEWDVGDWETKMGGNMSTSNHIKEKSVHIWTDQHVLFTVEMRDTYLNKAA